MRRRAIAIDPVVLCGTLISVILGGSSYFANRTNAVLAILVALLGTVTTLQIDTIMRIERKAKRDDEQTTLAALIERVPWLSSEIRRIAGALNAVSAHASGSRYLLQVAHNAINDCASTLDDLSRGQVRVPSEDNEALFEQTKNAKHSMLATSVPHVDMKWWCSEIGRRYWQVNVDALNRGVSVERIFIYREWTDQLKDLAEEQALAGATIWAVRAEDVPHHLRVDMIIWDRSFTYEIQLNSDGIEVANLYSVNASDIDRKLHCFDMLRSCGRRVVAAAVEGNMSCKPFPEGDSPQNHD